MTEEKKTILLRSKSAIQCKTIKNMMEDGCTPGEKGIPLPNVSSKILSKVIEYLNNHNGELELTKWDKEFLKVDMKIVFDITMAANYLNVKNLLDVVCSTIENHIENLSLEEILQNYLYTILTWLV
ncbi:hypothetical protein AMTRI_Chr01g113150 [Amborella trichopoda]